RSRTVATIPKCLGRVTPRTAHRGLGPGGAAAIARCWIVRPDRDIGVHHRFFDPLSAALKEVPGKANGDRRGRCPPGAQRIADYGEKRPVYRPNASRQAALAPD